MKKFLALCLSDVVFIMLINVKMPTIIGILTFMSRKISCLAELSMKKVYNLRACSLICLCTLIAQIANNMDPDQTVPLSQQKPADLDLYCFHKRV